MNLLRLTRLKEATRHEDGRMVVYWMQQSQRVKTNHALDHAIRTANAKNVPLVVLFVLTDGYPEANLRHYAFMAEGLKETKASLEDMGIPMVVKIGDPVTHVAAFSRDAGCLVMDEGYVRIQRTWRAAVLDALKDADHLSVDVVDTDLIVPVRHASDKQEYGAYTIRPKIRRLYRDFIDHDGTPAYEGPWTEMPSDADLLDTDALLSKLSLDRSVPRSPMYFGGAQEAEKHLTSFIRTKADRYDQSNDPSLDLTSKMSMYLHFGQIAALDILNAMFEAQASGLIEDGDAFDGYVEQLLVRRELAFNFVWHQDGYDTFDKMTLPWAYETMDDHAEDQRPYVYDMATLILGKTHDPYWNSAMDEMRITGYMHNYMRMYWAKKIIEWTPTFEVAYKTILELNNTYFIDGRDPNSYTGVAWCFGRHDRPWTERAVFGKLRYMNDKGLERKFDIDAYVRRINAIKETYGT